MELQLSKTMTNQELAEVFRFIAEILKTQDANRFRVRAYENAASVFDSLPKPLHKMFLTDPDFDDLPGVGESINQKLIELFTTGNIKSFQKYVDKVPAGAWPLVQLKGVGGKIALRLAKHFKLNDETTALEKILKLAQQGEIKKLEGFGEKSEKEFIEEIETATDNKKRLSYNQAHQIAEKIIKHLKTNSDVVKIEAMGSLRRKNPTIGDIDIGLATNNMGSVKKTVKQMKNMKKIVLAGNQLIRILLNNDLQVDIKTVTPDEWGSFLQHFTGSKKHNIMLREYALARGQSLSEHGIKQQDSKTHQQTLKKYKDEESFYHALGLKLIPPQQRVGQDEIEKAKL